MNSQFLLTHFDRISDQPEAVPRLRQFILDLAVRGKLVERDLDDNLASDLDKRAGNDAHAKKVVPTASGARDAIETSRNSLSFRIPPQWKWARLVEIAEVSYGFAFESSRFNSKRQGMPLIRIRDISGTDTEAYFEGAFDESYIVRKGDYLVGMDGDFNVRKWKGRDALLNQRVMRIRNWEKKLRAEFLAIPLQMTLHRLHASTSQTTVKHLSAKQVNEIFLPFPSLAEQDRIVAKVDELMELCDRLQAAQQKRETRHYQLVAASNHHLNNGGSAEETRSHAKFYLSHLTRLAARPHYIKQLRNTILNLAVRGQLTREGVESAAQRSPARTTLLDFDIRVPSGWAVQPLINVATEIVDCPHSTPKWTPAGKLCVRTNQFRPGRLDLTDARFVSEETYLERIKRLEPAENDILYSREGGILGIACRVPTNTQLCLGQRMMLIRAGAKLDPVFLEMVLNSPLITQIAQAKTTGGAAPRINVATVKAYPIPLPPLLEQRRIITKVEELMALCDEMETQLTTSQNEAIRLLESVLYHALRDCTPEAMATGETAIRA